jgi:DNA invertase Pin-like site-specific DNA recombinase
MVEAWGRDQGLRVVKWYVDEGISASKTGKLRATATRVTLEVARPQWGQLVADLTSGRAPRVLVVQDVDRLSRNEADLYIFRGLVAGGVETHVVRDRKILTKENLDAETLMLGISGAVATAESRNKAQRVRDVTAQAHAEGRHTGKAPLGYRWTYSGTRRVERGKLVVHEPEARKIRKLFDIAAKGTLGLADLRRQAIKAGLLSATCSPTTIRLLLWHPIYVGGYRRQGPRSTCVDTPEGVNPPIVDRAVWQRVQDIYFAGSPRRVRGPAARTNGKARTHVLAGVFRCGDHPLQRNAARRQYRWRASSVAEFHGHREEDLVELLVEKVLGPVSVPPVALDTFTAKVREHVEAALPSVEQAQLRLEALRNKATRILDIVADPELCATQEERAKLTARRAKLLAEVESLEKLRDTAARAVPSEKELARVLDYLLGLGTGWKTDEAETQREILLTLLDFTDGPPVAINPDGTLDAVRYAPGWMDLQALVADAVVEHHRQLENRRRKDPERDALVAELDAYMAAHVQPGPRSRVTPGSGRGSGRRGSASDG